MRPLIIRARTPAGFVQRDPWSPAFDGILAASLMRERLGDDFYSQRDADMALVGGLPLEVERHGGRWWYCVSSPEPLHVATQTRRYYHRRFDDQHERYLVEGVKRVMTAAGPYKSSRLHETIVVCKGLEWRAIGDATDVRRLLAGVLQIGAGRARGHGAVTEWQVIEGDDAEAPRFRRPLPVEFALAHGREGRRMRWGIAPPARLAQAICDCVMP
jgi:CRISPR type IV-associated protein Csf3